MTREVSEAADKINWDDMEEVLVHIRPWVRVDGKGGEVPLTWIEIRLFDLTFFKR